MRCIAKIAEVVYPKLGNHPVVPLTPRRRAQSISLPYDSTPPVPSNEDSDSTRETEWDRETVERQKKISQDDELCEENTKSADDKDRSEDDSCSSSKTQTPESLQNKRGDSARSEREKYSSVVTKMLFEILQNLLSDLLTILEKVTYSGDGPVGTA